MDQVRVDTPHGRRLVADLGGEVTDREVNTVAETSYRRGFYQGVYAAIEALQEGFSAEQMEAWQRRLWDWRNQDHRGRIEFPEWLARSEEGLG